MTAETDLLLPTRLLDFNARPIRDLIGKRGWADLDQPGRMAAAYEFVRCEIAFGYNRRDETPASQVLADGYGQCNTKGILLMALLRALEVPCRMHGFTIHKALQRGVVPEPVYASAPDEIVHSWIEVPGEGDKWIALEGFILDPVYLRRLQQAFPDTQALCGYGAGTDCLGQPPAAWSGSDTYIQKTGIARDFGVFATPDAFFERHSQAFGPVQRVFFERVLRHWMNARVAAIRAGRLQPLAGRTHRHGAKALPGEG